MLPSLTSSRIPGRIASPKLRVLRPRGCLDGWAEACCFTGYGWGYDTCVWSNMWSSNLGWWHRSKMFETSCRPDMAQSPTISRKLPRTLRQWARFVSWPFVFNSCLLYLVIPILSKYLWFCAKMSQAASACSHVLPWHTSTVCLGRGVSSQSASSERGTGSGHEKSLRVQKAQGGKGWESQGMNTCFFGGMVWHTWLLVALELMWSCICQVIDYHCC